MRLSMVTRTIASSFLNCSLFFLTLLKLLKNGLKPMALIPTIVKISKVEVRKLKRNKLTFWHL